jgi:hypothetical protein
VDEFKNSLNIHDVQILDHNNKIGIILKGMKKIKVDMANKAKMAANEAANGDKQD